MKTFLYTCALMLMTGISACTDRDILESKPGVILPPVSNLGMEKDGEKGVILTWDIPTSLPAEINQPVSVFIQVSEITSPTTAVPVFNTTLSDAPSTFLYEVPDAEKTYHLTVKLYAKTKNTDENYSSDIYSGGQTVVYSP